MPKVEDLGLECEEDIFERETSVNDGVVGDDGGVIPRKKGGLGGGGHV